MKDYPHLSAGYPEPYDTIAGTYDRLQDWIINEWGGKSWSERVAFLHGLWSGRSVPVKTVLEICCGTGRMLEELVKRGYSVAGLDRSAAMLEQARRRLGPKVALVHAELPEIPVDQQFDAVICAGAALHYIGEEALAETFHQVASTVRAEGSFVFDILSWRMVEGRFSKNVWAADMGDLAFIWKFENHHSGAYCDTVYTQFLQLNGAAGQPYSATRELHRLYGFNPESIRRLARDAGFVDIAVHDNYSPHPATEETLHETWAFTRKQDVE